MKSELLKLDAPYNVIYAGGVVGRHIASLLTWREDKDGEMDVNPESYPVLDMGGEYPSGKLVPTDVEDCRVLCPPEGTNLYWVSKVIEFDFQQLEPAGAEYILDRMEGLGCRIVLPTEKNEHGVEVPVMYYKSTLYILRLKGLEGEPDTVYRVRSNRHEGFYFESQGTEEEIYRDLRYQLSIDQGYFYGELGTICFQTYDGMLKKVINRLNADQMIEGYKHDDNDDFGV